MQDFQVFYLSVCSRGEALCLPRKKDMHLDPGSPGLPSKAKGSASPCEFVFLNYTVTTGSSS